MSSLAASPLAVPAAPDRERHRVPGLNLLAFGGLALYGALRWGTLLEPAPTWRLVGLVALAVALNFASGRLARRSRWLIWITALPAIGTALVVCGVRWRWIAHLRLAVLWRSVDAGLGALPRALVPYNGINPDLRHVILLGAAALLLLAALIPSLSAGSATAQRARAALPLLTLAVVPVTLIHPPAAELEGLLLLILLAGYVWTERLARRGAGPATGLLLLAGVMALPVATWVRQPTPWINPSRLAGAFSPTDAARFSWAQTYAPLRWPRTGTQVFSVQARAPAYWKTENLDAFDGVAWTLAPAPQQYSTSGISAATLARWTQTLTITVGALATDQVITAGEAEQPRALAGALPGASPGTWLSPRGLGPGDSYRVRVYDPHPAAATLEQIHREPFAQMADYRDLVLPPTPVPLPKGPSATGALTVTFGAFGAGGGEAVAPGLTPSQTRAAIAASPYGGVYRLARRLAATSTTPYGFATAVLHLLGHGYRYDENPPRSGFPLVDFLLRSRAGYCQHFAGAMALLLRMAGIPARVATGFTSGVRDSGGVWVVDDLDAHAWVEAWFPGYGWITFDPTPPSAPERAASTAAAVAAVANRGGSGGAGSHGLGSATPKPAPGVPRIRRAGTAGRPGGISPLLPIGLVVLLAAAALLARLTVRLRAPAADVLTSELERAMRRCGRPLPPGTTLAGLERRMRDNQDALAYVRALREARYGPARPAPNLPTRRQRRGLRVWLRTGSGAGARVRGLWALPPLWVLLH